MLAIVYLLHDESCRECCEVKQIFELLKIPHTPIPCCEFTQASIIVGTCYFDGIKAIRRCILSGLLQEWLTEVQMKEDKKMEQVIT